MTTHVTLTGTGIPPVEPGRAGAGCLVRFRDDRSTTALQFDAGRATALRLAEAGQDPAVLDALFVTHHHSDHVSGIPDLVMAGWLKRPLPSLPTLVAPAGPAVRFLETMLDPYVDDIDVRVRHTGRRPPRPRVVSFETTTTRPRCGPRGASASWPAQCATSR